MNSDYRQILDHSYLPQVLMTAIGVGTGMLAKWLIGDTATWNLDGIVAVVMDNPLTLLAGFLLFVVAVCALLGSAWIGIGALTSRWSEMDPGDRVVRVGVLGLLAVCLVLIAYTALEFLFLAVAAVIVSLVIMKALAGTKRVFQKMI
ncbi:MAG: hypothetical protein JWN30_2578 [Bacilli bacterium]|nr:hypothetical protein [Bacilli bacterium]